MIILYVCNSILEAFGRLFYIKKDNINASLQFLVKKWKIKGGRVEQKNIELKLNL